MTTQSLDGVTVYTKPFKTVKGDSFFKKNKNLIGACAVAFLWGLMIAGNIMGYAINWNN